MKARILKLFTLLATSFLLVLAYQNCADKADSNGSGIQITSKIVPESVVVSQETSPSQIKVYVDSDESKYLLLDLNQQTYSFQNLASVSLQIDWRLLSTYRNNLTLCSGGYHLEVHYNPLATCPVVALVPPPVIELVTRIGFGSNTQENPWKLSRFEEEVIVPECNYGFDESYYANQRYVCNRTTNNALMDIADNLRSQMNQVK